MSRIPRASGFDNTLKLLAEGYAFGPRRFAQCQSDLFTTRLMLRKATCVTGREAAAMFYHPDRFTRRGAMPPTALKLLQDKGSVELQSGSAHRHRKQLFMSLMTADSIRNLVDETGRQWQTKWSTWRDGQQVVLHPEVQEILCRAVCAWAGVPLPDREVKRRTGEFAAMIGNAGSVGPRNWWSLVLRRRAERWAGRQIAQARAEPEPVPAQDPQPTGLRIPSAPRDENPQPAGPVLSPLQRIAWYRGLDGQLMDVEVAAVELLNILRPTVAVSRYIVFAALALHRFPECRRQLETGDGDYRHWFAQEVRRYYPFFPMIGGRVRVPFEWQGHGFEPGQWVLLDLYGTNHDPRLWEDPGAFRPARFRDWHDTGFDLIPQGAGDHHRGHRCPGEWITIELIKAAAGWLTSRVDYRIPEQDLSIDLSKMPALPASGLVIRIVRP